MTSPGAAAISVIVRTLGSTGHLRDALESLAGQTRRDFEVVVVDMSAGDVEAVLAGVASRLPRLRHLAVGRRLSRPAALNAGVGAASARYIGILDDDNLYDPEHLERLVTGLDSTGADFVYTGVRLATFDESGRQISRQEVAVPFNFERVILANFVYATASAYRKTMWERVGGYDERFVVLEDWDFIVRAAQAGTLVHLPVISGESRKFTGIDGVSTFALEVGALRRCHAGFFWKHRHLHRGRSLAGIRAVTFEHCKSRYGARSGLLALSIAGWRVELVADLLSWWRRSLIPVDLEASD
jgi:GT2 family glycosyltransferase